MIEGKGVRTVLVMGASSDIGLAVCRRYLSAGWRVIGHFRTWRVELEEFQDAAFEGWQADFADTAKLEASLKKEAAFFERADVLVNLAADYRQARFETASASEMLRALALNLVPGMLVTRTVGRAMVKRGFGRIVHASSIGVKFGGGSGSFCYSLSKHAQEFIPRSCRGWAKNNVFVNVLRIGVTNTRIHDPVPGKDMAARVKLIPAGRAAAPAEIAEAVFWFGSDTNGYCTGQVIDLAGGE